MKPNKKNVEAWIRNQIKNEGLPEFVTYEDNGLDVEAYVDLILKAFADFKQ